MAIDMDRVNAQQARRILDRIVGYEISPLLWRKVAKGLSAGRVQSVAVRLVVEREREIEAFVAQEYWSVIARLEQGGTEFPARLVKFEGQKLDRLSIGEAGMAEPVLREVGGRQFYVSCLRFTPRETDGSYKAMRERAVVFVNGRADRVLDRASEFCTGAVYAPFPELEKMTR